MRSNGFVSGIILLGAISAIICIVIMLQLPGLAKTKTEEILRVSGFKSISLTTPIVSISSVQYNNIKLDNNGFSTIKSLRIEYSWLDLLLHNHITRIIIDGVELTGELDKNQKVHIDGWQPQFSGEALQQMFRTREIIVRNAQASLLNEQFGSISINAEVHAYQADNGTVFNGKLINTQKFMRYSTKFNGKINTDRTGTSQVEIEDIKMDMPHLKATRAQGLVKTNKDKNMQAEINGNLTAGNITIVGFPWKSASITLEGDPTKPYAIIAAKALNENTVELGLALDNIYDTDILSGYLYTPHLKNILDYIENHASLPFERSSIASLENLQNIEFEYSKNNNNFEFEFKSTSLPFSVHGFTQLKNLEHLKFPDTALEIRKPGKLEITNNEFLKLIPNSTKDRSNIVRALSNLNYSKIITQIVYAGEGLYDFNIEIEGTSPNIASGQKFKVDFDIKTDIETLANALIN